MSSTWQFMWQPNGSFAITEFENVDGDVSTAPVLQRMELPRDILIGFLASVHDPEDLADNAWYEISDEELIGDDSDEYSY